MNEPALPQTADILVVNDKTTLTVFIYGGFFRWKVIMFTHREKHFHVVK